MSGWPWRGRRAAPEVATAGDLHGIVVIGSNNVITQNAPARAIGAGIRHTLTGSPGALVDRVAELDALRAPVSPAAPECRAVVGLGGVGKSALARTAAHHLRDQFPDVQYELDLLGHTPGAEPLSADAALERMLSWAAIGTDPTGDLATRAGAWRGWLRGKRSLLLLDNAASFEQIECLLPGYPGCLVLITSRHSFSDARVTNVELGGLPSAHAVELLTGRRTEAVPAPRGAVLAEISRACGNIPAALNSVAAVLSDGTDPAELLADMADASHPLAGLPSVDEAIGKAFELSRRALTDDQRDFLGLLALHPGRDFTVDLAAALGGLPRHEARRRVAELRARHLLERMGDGRYGFHDVYLPYARALAPEDEATRSAVLHRISARLGPAAVAALDALVRASSPEEIREARTWISAEHGNLVAVTLAAAGMGEDFSWDMAEVATALGGWLGYRTVNSDIWRNMLSMAENDKAEHRQARALRGLAHESRVQGRYDEAIDGYTRARDIFRDHHDRRAEADTWWGLGEIHRTQDRLDEARDAYGRAKNLYESEGDRRGEANALWGIGNVLLHEGRYPESRTVFGEVRELCAAVADRRGEAQAMRGIADVERMLEHRTEARDFYLRAIEIYEGIGDLHGHANSLRGLGHLDRVEGRLETAVGSFTKALDLAEELGDLRVQANMLRGLGDAERQRGRLAEAREALVRSVDLNRRLGNSAGLGYALRVLADVERAEGRFAEARRAYEESLAAFRAGGGRDGKGVADALSAFAELAVAEGEFPEARRHLTLAAEIYEGLGIPEPAAARRTRLSDLPSET
ncbi:hypothetical protein GCM10022221_23980 [Actinocorallia aurea]